VSLYKVAVCSIITFTFPANALAVKRNSQATRIKTVHSDRCYEQKHDVVPAVYEHNYTKPLLTRTWIMVIMLIGIAIVCSINCAIGSDLS